MELVATGFHEDDRGSDGEFATRPRPRLRSVDGGEHWASAGDRAMIESTLAALNLVAGKWKVEVLYLLAARVRRHGRLRDHLLVSKKVLSDTLKALERDGLVRRQVFAERPVRVEYSLTALGRSLTVVLFTLHEWAEEHMDDVSAARAHHDRRHGRSRTHLEDVVPRFTAPFQVMSDQRRAA
jgi:DNA-binding HxlR family transcriptional regulator